MCTRTVLAFFLLALLTQAQAMPPDPDCANDLRPGWRPPAPVPHEKPLGLTALARAVWRNPLEVWAKKHFEEPIVVMNLPFARVMIVNSPGAVRRVLLDNAANYPKDAIQKRINSGAIGNSLLMADGDSWRMQRNAIAPLFSHKAITEFAPAMQEEIDRMIRRWSLEPDGRIRNITDDLTELSYGILEQTLFSIGNGRSANEFRIAMRRYFESIGHIDPFDLMGLPDYVPRLTRFGPKAALIRLNRAIDTLIAERRSRSNDAPTDVLTLLLSARDPKTGDGLSDEQLRGNIIAFMTAGHEPMASVISWSLFLLSRSPEWQSRVIAEAGEPPSSLVSTRAVVEEAIRLYPPLPAISRTSLSVDHLQGCPVIPQTFIVIAPYLLHRHRMLWDRPDDFDPTRFMPPRRDRVDRFAFLPFGAGLRVCIGIGFALQEATMAVASIVQNFDLQTAPGFRVWPVQRQSLRPDGGLRMMVFKRYLVPITEAGRR